MTTTELVENFVHHGATAGSASNKRLRIEGDKLINYSTVIAVRTNSAIVLNGKTYSMTTTKHQNRIRRNAESKWGLELIEVDTEEEVKSYL